MVPCFSNYRTTLHGGGGIGKGKLYFLLLKLVKCQEGPLGQRKVSQLILSSIEGRGRGHFLSCPCFYFIILS